MTKQPLRLVAKKGTIITCPNGHEVCEAAVNIRPPSGSIIKSRWFKNWRHGKPDEHSKVQPCKECGERWLRVSIFSDGEWR